MAGYLGSVPVPQATQHRESFTCTEGQTSFASAGYTAQFVDVYLNGSHLSPADFTATNGSDVVLAVAASADDVCDIISYTPFEVANQTFTGTTTMTDVVAATLDISGDIDVDGTTNLDVVDIDGAVDMASTLTVTGGATINGSAVFNQDAADVDFRIEGNEQFAFFVHGADSSVQMGGASQQTVGTLAPGRLLLLNDNNSNPELKLFRQDTSIGNGANLGEIVAYSNDTADNDIMPVASIGFFADGTFSATNNPSQILFNNTPASSETIRQVGRFDALGNFEIANTGGTIVTATAGTSNFRAGVNAGNSIASGGNYNVCVGDEAGTAISTGDYNTAVGFAALKANTNLNSNTAIGAESLFTNINGAKAVAVGTAALYTQNPDSDVNTHNVAVGFEAGKVVSTGTLNTFVGALAGDGTDDGEGNTAVGYLALSANCGDHNTSIGSGALKVCTGASNTAAGENAGAAVTSGNNNMLLGVDAGLTGSPGGNLTTGGNNIHLGDENINSAHIQVDWTVASDQRDKTDFTALDLGLDFVKALAPVTYKWDKRSKYGDKYADDYDLAAQTPDGTHKEDWLDIGFKAQEVQALEEAAGYTIAAKKNLTVSTSEDGKQMGLQYSKFVPILVKAIQEQNALIEALTARVAVLEG